MHWKLWKKMWYIIVLELNFMNLILHSTWSNVRWRENKRYIFLTQGKVFKMAGRRVGGICLHKLAKLYHLIFGVWRACKQIVLLRISFWLLQRCHQNTGNMICKVLIFWEGHKILRNLHLTFDWHNIGQK